MVQIKKKKKTSDTVGLLNNLSIHLFNIFCWLTLKTQTVAVFHTTIGYGRRGGVFYFYNLHIK